MYIGEWTFEAAGALSPFTPARRRAASTANSARFFRGQDQDHEVPQPMQRSAPKASRTAMRVAEKSHAGVDR